MCGIIGAISSENSLLTEHDNATLAKMLKLINHRGPDGSFLWKDTKQKASLGHARLSVIDLNSGWQPLEDSYTGCIISYNGELYNYLELRSELKKAGFIFETQSDTEVVLKSYICWGREAYRKFNGIFAFIIYDPRDNTAIMARDHFGVKPLYYGIRHGILWIASELRSLVLADGSASPSLDIHALHDYCSIGYALAPRTLLKGLSQLPHGCIGIWKSGELQTKRMFDLAEELNEEKSEQNNCDHYEELSSLIDQAVHKQLMSDVPLGTFLSGGVDSTLITLLASRHTNRPLKSFTMGFDNPNYSEVPNAKKAALAMNIDHHIYNMRSQEVLDLWEAIAWKTDAPIFDNSFLPTYVLFQEARRHVTVCLSGDGADEIFLGYDTFRADHIQQTILRFLPFLLNSNRAQIYINRLAELVPTRFGKINNYYKLYSFLRSINKSVADSHSGWRELVDRRLIPDFIRAEWYNTLGSYSTHQHFINAFNRMETKDTLTRLSYVDLETWLPNNILVKVDRASMAHGLEVRVPFLDIDLVKFVMNMPSKKKFRFFENKILLRKLLSKKLSSYKVDRKKRGFNSPMSETIMLNKILLHKLEQPHAHIFEYISYKLVNEMIRSHRKQKRDYGMILWGLVVLEKWFSNIKERYHQE
ncbi:MAG TPA: asparagine synthase (glutamine-hydrolyzing) [Bdellovibrionota bacterium]|nr:asparagine synthase (glutamine-hydrolyzing) [Bdellovibrionota bacterium]